MAIMNFSDWDHMMRCEDGEHYRLPYEERRERWLKHNEVTSNPKAAHCSYCERVAVYRIGADGYELHSCSLHETAATEEFNIANGANHWRMTSRSSIGFPAPVIQEPK